MLKESSRKKKVEQKKLYIEWFKNKSRIKKKKSFSKTKKKINTGALLYRDSHDIVVKNRCMTLRDMSLFTSRVF